MKRTILFIVLTVGLAGCSLDKKLTSMSDQMNKVSASAADMDAQLKQMSQYTKELVDIMKKLIGGLTNPGGGPGNTPPPGNNGPGNGPIPPGPIPPGPIPGNSPIPGNGGTTVENAQPGDQVAQGNMLSGKIDLSTKPMQELQDIDAMLKQAVAMKSGLDQSNVQPDPMITAMLNNIEIIPPQTDIPTENQALIVEISSLLVQLRGGQSI
jgi:Prokaryotic membrane lipoprotein lipid attachment site